MAAAGPGVALAPHLAVYDLSLASATSGASIAGVRGRMVHEFTGGPCQGYNVSMRWVAQMADQDGGVSIDDVRLISWEGGDGDTYSYSSTRLQNDEVVEEVKATAERGTGERSGKVSLVKPDKAELPLPPGTIFPTTHLKRVIDAALSGARFAQDQVYDVSEDGRKIYSTLAVVSPLREDRRADGIEGVENAQRLDDLAGWRVRISYFEGAEKGEETPAFEQTFDLFSNGVATDLLLDYGDIVVRGTLSKLEFLPPPDCKDR